MTTTRAPAELIPATPQRLWGVPAVLNFALGGLGAGFYVAAALSARFEASATLALAAWLGPALVLAGFAAVATEAGRPLRGARVLARVRTSWMSRELVLGAVFAAAALAEWVVPAPAARAAAALAALGLAAAQGFIVRRAKAIPAWDVPVLPVVFAASALVSGAGLVLAVEAAHGERPDGALLGGALAVVIVGFVAWRTYVTWSDASVFAQATAPLRVGPGVTLGIAGYLVPAVTLALALALPPLGLIAPLAGVLMVAGQAWTKWLLILTVATLRPVTLGTLQLGRRIT
jgi:phenylacetyl-CoA:acceptor oxidoreductase subunit 2